MSQPLIIYTLRPESYPAKVFAEYLAATCTRPVQLRPLSELPAPPSWLTRRRQQLEAEQQLLLAAVASLDMGLRLAAADTYRYLDWVPKWQADKAGHETRLQVVAWKLRQLTQFGDSAPERGGAA